MQYAKTFSLAIQKVFLHWQEAQLVWNWEGNSYQLLQSNIFHKTNSTSFGLDQDHSFHMNRHSQLSNSPNGYQPIEIWIKVWTLYKGVRQSPNYNLLGEMSITFSVFIIFFEYSCRVSFFARSASQSRFLLKSASLWLSNFGTLARYYLCTRLWNM